jgi:hypothetical protein
VRIRSIKPEFWRSADINALSLEDRLLFIGLWSYVDDNGVGRDELPVIVADLFAGDMFADSRETVARVSRGLSNLFSAGLIDRYSFDGKAYLMISKWEKHQRIDKPAKERFPRSDGHAPVVRETVATPSRDSRDTLAPGTGEQGNRGTEEQSAPAALVSLFDDAYNHWPKKVERKKSLDKFKQAAKHMDPTLLRDHIIRFGDAYAATTDRQFVPALNVWITGERWTDELPAAPQLDRHRLLPSAPSPRAEWCPVHEGWPHPESVYGCDRCKEENERKAG